MVEKNEKLARNILIGLITVFVVGIVAIAAVVILPSKREPIPAPKAYATETGETIGVKIGPNDDPGPGPNANPNASGLSIEDRLDLYGLYSTDFETVEDYEAYMDAAFRGPEVEPRRGISLLMRLTRGNFNADVPIVVFDADGDVGEEYANYWEYIEKCYPELLYTARNIYAETHDVSVNPTQD